MRYLSTLGKFLGGRAFGTGTLLILISVALAAPATSEPIAGDRIALIIGNSAYQNASRLANPGNDAVAMAEVLSAAGFEIYGGKPLLDASWEEMGRAIRGFGKQLKKHSIGIFYFAGHGAQIDGNNYLFPVSAKVEDPSDAKWELIELNTVLKEMEQASNTLNILILDACRNNPLLPPGSMRGATNRGLAEVTAPRGTWISYAAGPGQQAIDAIGAHSPYTQALIETVKEPGLSLYQVFNKVALKVEGATNGKQAPWSAQSPISSEFYFLRPTTGILEFHVSPTTATLRLDGVVVGSADGFRKELAAGPHEYELTAPAFETRHGVISITAGGEKSTDIALTVALPVSLPPSPPLLPKTGTLEIDATTPGALLRLDGIDYGAAKGFRQEIEPGKHKVEVAADGYETRYETVDVPAGSAKSLILSLNPLIAVQTPRPPPPPTTGMLAFEVTTPGAAVSIDGKPMGLAKGFRRELAVGEHQIEISADGFEPVKQIVAIAPGVERSLVLSLSTAPNPAPPQQLPALPDKDTGFLSVTTDPSTAQISVDGIVQKVPGTVHLEVPPGEHIISAKGKGFVEQRLIVKVDRGERVQVPLQLARLPSPRPPPQYHSGADIPPVSSTWLPPPNAAETRVRPPAAIPPTASPPPPSVGASKLALPPP